MGFVLAKEKPGTPGGYVYLTDVTLVETADGLVRPDAKTALFVDDAYVFPDVFQAETWSQLILAEGFVPAELPEAPQEQEADAPAADPEDADDRAGHQPPPGWTAGPEPDSTGALLYICGADARAQRREAEDRRNLRALIAPFIEAEAAAGVSPRAIELGLSQAGVEVTDWDRTFIRRTAAARPRSRSCPDHSGFRAEAGG